MPKLTDQELISIIDSEFESAMGKEGGEISLERAKAFDYYLSKRLGNEVEGQSSIVSSDVADVVDGIMPSLLRIFTSAENLVSFDPVGPEDEDQAEQESDYVNYVFFKHNPSFLLMFYWFFDALVQKNGIVKAWWDESEEITNESYQSLSLSELTELLDDDELEPIEQSQRVEETVDEMTGDIVVATVYDVSFRRVSKRGRARVENVPPEEYRISSDARSLDPTDARMIGQEREIKRSDLLGMGFDKDIVEKLSANNSHIYRSSETISRYNKTDEQFDSPRDPSQDSILVREAYIRVDYDGDGRSELRQVFTSGNHILSNEPADRQPFHVICPAPLPHKHFGRSSAEKVMDVQEVNTTLTRQTLDNLYHTNNPGHAVWEQAIGENTLDDLLTTRIGAVRRFTRPVGEAYSPMTVPFTAGQSFPMIQYFDKVKRDRTGISSDGEGLSPEALKNIQTSVLAQASDMSRMKIEAVARIFAETGIKSLFLHIHELLLKHQNKPQIAKLRGQWVPVNPQEWRTRLDMTVNIGLGIGNRESNLLHLNAIWEKQRDVVAAGGYGTLVTPRNIYNTAAEIVKNANLKQPGLYFTETDEITPQSDEQQQIEQMQIQLAQRQQELDAAKQQLNQDKAALQHERELMKITLQKEQQEDRLMVEMEKIRNDLTRMELQYEQNVPGAR